MEHGHKDGKCTFEVIMEKYSVRDPYVLRIAEIVHAADIKGEEGRAPEAKGIKALLDGLRFVTGGDHETLEVGMLIWEAIYAHLKLEDLREKLGEELERLSKTERLRHSGDTSARANSSCQRPPPWAPKGETPPKHLLARSR